MGLVIAGERSGAGKTTITLALLAALTRRSQRVQSFKVGPDYIDPMFHRWVTGRPCRNLDPVLTSEAYVQQCYRQHAPLADCAVVEGVMGLFDGATGAQDWASTAHIARLLNLPVLLVLDCSRLSRSVAAIAHGFRSFDPRLQLAGLVLNRVGSDRHLELLTAALEPLHLPILGVLRREDTIALPSRHLGLVPAEEVVQLETAIAKLADLGETCFRWETLMPLLQTTARIPNSNSLPSTSSPPSPSSSSLPSSPLPTPHIPHPTPHPVKLAIARDRAFSFYYEDNLELLQQLGAELQFWSPLRDRALPPGCQGLYFGGGFPEVFAEELSTNQPGRVAVQTAIQAGMPVYSECGGLMYLGEAIQDFEQQAWPMVGAIPATTYMQPRLNLGYRRAIAQRDSPLLVAGETVWGHEFHRSGLTVEPTSPLYRTWRYDEDPATQPGRTEGWQQGNLHASYVHLHFGAMPQLPQRFLQHCQQWSGKVAFVPKNL